MFSFYKEGVLSNDHEAKMPQYLEYTGVAKHHKKEQQLVQNKQKQVLSDKSLEDYGISWMNLNHSVLIIGWGVDQETGTKYWKIRNSYGPAWGQSGDFLVRRGQNDFGVETETTAYDARLCSSASKSTCIEEKLH